MPSAQGGRIAVSDENHLGVWLGLECLVPKAATFVHHVGLAQLLLPAALLVGEEKGRRARTEPHLQPSMFDYDSMFTTKTTSLWEHQYGNMSTLAFWMHQSIQLLVALRLPAGSPKSLSIRQANGSVQTYIIHHI